MTMMKDIMKLRKISGEFLLWTCIRPCVLIETNLYASANPEFSRPPCNARQWSVITYTPIPLKIYTELPIKYLAYSIRLLLITFKALNGYSSTLHLRINLQLHSIPMSPGSSSGESYSQYLLPVQKHLGKGLPLHMLHQNFGTLYAWLPQMPDLTTDLIQKESQKLTCTISAYRMIMCFPIIFQIISISTYVTCISWYSYLYMYFIVM